MSPRAPKTAAGIVKAGRVIYDPDGVGWPPGKRLIAPVAEIERLEAEGWLVRDPNYLTEIPVHSGPRIPPND